MSSTIELLHSKLENAADRLARSRRANTAPSWRVLAQAPDGSSVKLRGHAARAFALAACATHSGEVYHARKSVALRSLMAQGLIDPLPFGGYAVSPGARISRVGIC